MSESDARGPDQELNPLEIWRTIFNWVADPTHSNAVTAVATVIICLTGVVYTVFAGGQWEAAKGAAEAAKSAADTSAKQLEMAERPWLSIVNARVVSPLAWGQNGLQATVQFDVKNTGPTPAPMLMPVAELFVLPVKPPGVAEHLAGLCSPSNIVPGVLPELVVPPNDKVTETLTIGLGETGNSPVAVVVPIISVRYRPTFQAPRSYPYCTALSYDFWPTIFKAQLRPGYSIPMDQLNFQVNSMFGEIFH
jgi:hypothetical protein